MKNQVDRVILGAEIKEYKLLYSHVYINSFNPIEAMGHV